MKLLKYITAIAGIVLFFSTCKKYPEGGFQNQAKKHIVGNWTLTLYEVDGVDSTELINYNGNNGYKNINISKLKTTSNTHTIRTDNQVGIGFSLLNKNSKLKIESSYSSMYCVPQGNCYKIIWSPEMGDVIWNIQKLTKNELILQATLHSNYTLKLRK